MLFTVAGPGLTFVSPKRKKINQKNKLCLCKGSSIKYVRSDFVILGHSRPCSCTFAFSLHPLPDNIFQRGHGKDMFCELLLIKKPQTSLQNKKYCYAKLNQNTKRSHGIEFALFNCKWDMGIDNFCYVNSSLYFISIL